MPTDIYAMTEKAHILLVDDEQIIRENLGALLERNGFVVTTATNGEEGMEIATNNTPDVIVMDVMMPQLNGREALRLMREQGIWTPVILLTQVGDADERALALEEGADDYLNKPFNTHELIARIKTVLRRVQAKEPLIHTATTLLSGALSLDRTARRAWMQGEELSLTPKAITLLEYLMVHPNTLISRERLLDVVWGWDYPVGTRAVDTRVSELRRQLGDDASDPTYIETVSGQGYRFVGKVSRAE